MPDALDSGRLVEQQEFSARLRALDLDLFSHIPSETNVWDKRSLLALHNACRECYGSFRYLEIGSHLGGSLQALIVDERCTQVISIDSRPPSQPDNRGPNFDYPGNSTQRMLEHLRGVPGSDLSKLRTIDAGTDEIAAEELEGAAELCFIDGEHTDAAALRDARFCARVVNGNGGIAFHDRRIVPRAIDQFIRELEPGSFTTYALPLGIVVVELGPQRLAQTDLVREYIAWDDWQTLRNAISAARGNTN